jgi:hypothetical protein
MHKKLFEKKVFSLIRSLGRVFEKNCGIKFLWRISHPSWVSLARICIKMDIEISSLKFEDHFCTTRLKSNLGVYLFNPPHFTDRETEVPWSVIFVNDFIESYTKCIISSSSPKCMVLSSGGKWGDTIKNAVFARCNF